MHGRTLPTHKRETLQQLAILGATKIFVPSEIQGVQGGEGLGLLIKDDHGCVKLAMAKIYDNI